MQQDRDGERPVGLKETVCLSNVTVESFNSGTMLAGKLLFRPSILAEPMRFSSEESREITDILIDRESCMITHWVVELLAHIANGP